MSTSSRPRTSGVSTAARQQQQPAQNFKPKSEWKHQDDASFLSVFLPGFALEQFTITPDYSNGTVRIEGKRRLPNNRLSPVDETYTIPEGCELSNMDKQIGRGVLVLKMPRNIVVPQIVGQQQALKETKEETPEMTGKVEETSTTGLEKQSPDKVAIYGMVTTNMEEKSAMAGGKSDEKKVVERTEENDNNYTGNGIPGRQESLAQNDGVKEEDGKAKSKEVKESAMTLAMSVAKVDEEKPKENEKKEKSPKSADAEEKDAKKKKLNASANKGMVKELNDDRKLRVNMGIAVLIIVVLGVSLFYRVINQLSRYMESK